MKKNLKSEKKPNVIRNAGLRTLLKSSLLNLNSEWVDVKKLKKSNGRFNCVDLFSGAGGITCGFDMAGLNSLMGVEIVPVASETYKNNFPNSITYNGDVRELTHEKLRELIGGNPVHVFTGGFPCQGFL